MIYGPFKEEVVDEIDVETCLELARMYDTEDITSPPFRMDDDEIEEEEE